MPFLYDEEIGKPDTDSKEYQAGFWDGANCYMYNQQYSLYESAPGVWTAPPGGFNYDQGFKAGYRQYKQQKGQM